MPVKFKQVITILSQSTGNNITFVILLDSVHWANISAFSALYAQYFFQQNPTRRYYSNGSCWADGSAGKRAEMTARA